MAVTALAVTAQPKARRNAAQQKTQTAGSQLTRRAQLMFPTAIEMPSDVVWRRDIYREIDLNKEANSGLYYPVEPIDKQLNLLFQTLKYLDNAII